MKNGVKSVVEISGHFRASFPEEEEAQNFTRNFTAVSMATSIRGFWRKFHGSTSASLAEMKLEVRYLLCKRDILD